jgi:hypothetical protein
MTKRFSPIEIQTFFSAAPKKPSDYDARGIPSIMGFKEIIPNGRIRSPVFPFAGDGFQHSVLGTNSRWQTWLPLFFLLWSWTYGWFHMDEFIQVHPVERKKTLLPFGGEPSPQRPSEQDRGARWAGLPQRFAHFDWQREDVPSSQGECFSFVKPGSV